MSKMWAVVLSVIIAGLIVGFGTYYFINSKAEKDKQSLQSQITTLNNQITTLQKAQTAPPTASTSASTSGNADLKTYTSTKYGFSFSYPKNWKVSEPNSTLPDKGISVVDLTSPDAPKPPLATEQTPDMSVTYYASIADRAKEATKASSIKTVSDLFKNSEGLDLQVLEPMTTVGGDAFDAYVQGMNQVYTIFAGNKSHLYEIQFNNIEDVHKLTDAEKKIIASWKFQ